MPTAVHTHITTAQAAGRKLLAVLVDPDKAPAANMDALAAQNGADIWLVGGSLLSGDSLTQTVRYLKQHTTQPVVLFPGHATHITPHADAILFLSLISGRNPDLLIGQHVIAAPQLRASGIEVLPTGYMLIDGGRLTTVNYMSQTLPIPADKPDIARCTAMAGEMLGLKLIYMDAGSGAEEPVPTRMIRAVRTAVQAPLIIGGGIRTPELAYDACRAGADVVVVGNVLEKSPTLLAEIADAVHSCVKV